MRYLLYEIAGWVLLALGLYTFYRCFELFETHHIWESFPATVIGFFVFRGGLYLIKVGVAARVCATAPAEPTAAAPTAAALRTARLPASSSRRIA